MSHAFYSCSIPKPEGSTKESRESQAVGWLNRYLDNSRQLRLTRKAFKKLEHSSDTVIAFHLKEKK